MKLILPDNMALCQVSLNKFFPGYFFVGHLVGEEKEEQSAGADGRHGRVTLLVAVAAAESSRLCCVLEKLGEIGLLTACRGGLGRRWGGLATTFWPFFGLFWARF